MQISAGRIPLRIPAGKDGRVKVALTDAKGRARVEPDRFIYERITFAWQQATSRQPDAREQSLIAAIVTAARAEFEKDPAAATALVKTGISPVPDNLDATDLATWTSAARVLLNLNETVTRN